MPKMINCFQKSLRFEYFDGIFRFPCENYQKCSVWIFCLIFWVISNVSSALSIISKQMIKTDIFLSVFAIVNIRYYPIGICNWQTTIITANLQQISEVQSISAW